MAARPRPPPAVHSAGPSPRPYRSSGSGGTGGPCTTGRPRTVRRDRMTASLVAAVLRGKRVSGRRVRGGRRRSHREHWAGRAHGPTGNQQRRDRAAGNSSTSARQAPAGSADSVTPARFVHLNAIRAVGALAQSAWHGAAFTACGRGDQLQPGKAGDVERTVAGASLAGQPCAFHGSTGSSLNALMLRARQSASMAATIRARDSSDARATFVTYS